MADFRCGFVAIVGRPNVGKSTLINKLLNKKIAIVTQIPQTTRNAIRGIYNAKNSQIIFVDTPGLHIPKDQFGKLMNKTSSNVIEEADVIIHLVDASRPVGEEEKRIVDKLKDIKKPIVLGLNKIDLGTKYLSEYLQLWQEATQKDLNSLADFVKLMPMSGLQGTHIEELVDVITQFLPEGPALFPKDMASDFPERIFLSEIVREKLFNHLKEEIPYGLGVSMEEVTERSKKLTVLRMAVFVDTESQKKIVIGHNAGFLKQAGTEARQEIEKLLNKKVFLELHVKVKKDWRRDLQSLREFGFIE
jgi:GTP-binding protein Era